MSNIKVFNLSSVFLELNALVVQGACDHTNDGIPQTGNRVAAGALSLLHHMLLTKSPESSIRIPFTLYGCPSLVNQGFCRALINQGFCIDSQIGEAEGAPRRIVIAHVEARDADWSSRANLTK
jgi:hypothetical protein